VAWSKQLSEKDVKEFTPENILSNNNSGIQTESNWFSSLKSKPFEWPATKK